MNYKVMNCLAFATVAATVFTASAPLRASETDDQVEASFKTSYVYMTYLTDDAIKAESKNGLVTLTGTVSEESHKTLAQEMASCLPGVTLVDNRLATKAEAAAENADLWIERKARLALLFHRNVNSSTTAVEVKDGVVTLRGEASDAAQKELTTEYIKDIEGVKSVKNETTVAKNPVVKAAPILAKRTTGAKIDDASITAQVKTALLIHRSTSSVGTKVTTRDGTITLTGIAKNAAEKSLVTKLASDIQGVTSVNNEMTVEAPQTK